MRRRRWRTRQRPRSVARHARPHARVVGRLGGGRSAPRRPGQQGTLRRPVAQVHDVRAVGAERLHVGGQQRQHRTRAHEQRDLVGGRGHRHRAPALEHARGAQPRRAVLAHRRRAPEVHPATRRQVELARRRAGREHGRDEHVGSEQVLVVGARGARVVRVGERELAHERQPGAVVGPLGRGQVGLQLGAQLRVARPHRQHVGVEDLRPRRRRIDREPGGLGAHDPGGEAELDPAPLEVGRGLGLRDGEVAADVRAPQRHARQAHAQPVAHRAGQAVEAEARRGVAAPHDLRHARRPGPARAVEARQRPRRAVLRVRVGGAVVEHRVRVVHLRAGRAVGRLRVGRRVLAEVLHPAVVAVADRLAQQVAVEPHRARRGEVELADREHARARVRVDVGLPGRVRVQERRPPPPGRRAAGRSCRSSG